MVSSSVRLASGWEVKGHNRRFEAGVGEGVTAHHVVLTLSALWNPAYERNPERRDFWSRPRFETPKENPLYRGGVSCQSEIENS